MSYAFTRDVPGNIAIYEQIKGALGDTEPPGLIARIVTVIPGGLRHLQIWESEQAWQGYQRQHVEPAVDAVLTQLGITPQPQDVRFTELELVDVAFGATKRGTARADGTQS